MWGTYVNNLADVVYWLRNGTEINIKYWCEHGKGSYPCPSAVSLQYIWSVSAVSTSCALDRPAVHKGYHLTGIAGLVHVNDLDLTTLYFKWSAVLQEKYYILCAEVSFEVQWSTFWNAAKCILRCTGIALQTDVGRQLSIENANHSLLDHVREYEAIFELQKNRSEDGHEDAVNCLVSNSFPRTIWWI